jgi:outer membrane protein assembly factor BamA
MKTALSVLLLFVVWNTQAQEAADSAKNQRYFRVLPVPAFGYEPETNWHIGAVALFTFDMHADSVTRPSNLNVEFNYTLRRQRIVDAGWNWFSAKERWFSKGYVEWSYYPDYYFGIGAGSKTADRLLFESQRTIIDVGVYRSIAPAWYAGGIMQFADYSRMDKSLQASFAELKAARIARFGPAMLYDSRNNLLNPTQGSYINAYVGHTWSGQRYWQGILDARHYFKRRFGVVALRFLMRHVGDGAPFYDLSVMGGDQAVRGYFYGRFRDDGFSVAQAEWRSPVWKRCGMAVFGGYAALYNSFPTTELGFFENYGLGFRYLIDRKSDVNLRFDYARGKNGESGFYIGFGESF